MPRKPRSDSTAEMTRIMQGATLDIQPPAHMPLQPNHWPYWESVLAEFARADWSEHQLELAVFLSRSMAQADEQQRLLEEEGFTITREIYERDGKTIRKILSYENSRARAVQQLFQQILNIRRSLALHARGKHPSSKDAADKREANKATERKASGGKGDKSHLLA